MHYALWLQAPKWLEIDTPKHVRILEPDICITCSVKERDDPSTQFCPANICEISSTKAFKTVAGDIIAICRDNLCVSVRPMQNADDDERTEYYPRFRKFPV